MPVAIAPVANGVTVVVLVVYARHPPKVRRLLLLPPQLILLNAKPKQRKEPAVPVKPVRMVIAGNINDKSIPFVIQPGNISRRKGQTKLATNLFELFMTASLLSV
jgi:hypothetical protein